MNRSRLSLGLVACLLTVFSLLYLSLAKAGEIVSLYQQLRSGDETPAQTSPKNSGLLEPLPTFETSIEEIGIERTRCLAGCPAYTLVVQRNGKFRYEGSYGVDRIGQYTGTVSVGRLNQVLAFIDEANFAAFENSYSAQFLDGPAVYTLVKDKAGPKVIENYAGTGPATLWAIEQLIDDLLETAEWNAKENEF